MLSNRSSQERYQTVIHGANIAILLIDAKGDLLEVNQKAEVLTGYSARELTGMNIDQLDSGMSISERAALDENESRHERYFNCDAPLRCKNGDMIPVRIRGSVTGFEADEVCLLIVTDITDQYKTEQALRASKDWAEHIFRLVPSAIFTVDPKGNITSFNKQAEEITGYSADEVLGKNCTVFAMPPCSTKCGLFQCELDEPMIGKICTIRKKDGELLTASKNLDLLRDEQGNIVGGVESFEDITRRKRAEESLRESEERYRTLAEAAHDMIFIIDRDGRVEYVNCFAAEHLGLNQGDLIGRLVAELFPPETALGFGKNLGEVIKCGQPFYGEANMLTARGELWIGTRLTPIKNEAGEISAVLGISRDITERKKSEEVIKHMAYYDSLTDLPNRMFFTEQLNSAISSAHRNQEMMAVVFLDLDNFKAVNDTLGHCVGDQLLRDAGRRLKDCLRESDFIARFGGDEFVLLLTQINCAQDAEQVAQKVFEAMKPPFNLDGHEFHVTTSIGISLYPNDGQDASFLLRNADAALYYAKEQGRNNYQFYSPSLAAKAS